MTRKRVAVTLGLVALTAYAILKAAWGLGSLVGIEDRAEFDRVFGSLTPSQVWLATWGTVVLAAAGGALLIAVAAGSATPMGRGQLGRLVRGIARVVSVVLGFYSLVALGATIVRDGPFPFASWVVYLTYGSFLVFAIALGQVLWAARAGSFLGSWFGG